MITHGHFIDGQTVQPGNSRSATLKDPATGRSTAEVLLAEEDIVNAACRAAAAAAPHWRTTPPLRRARFLARYKQLVDQHAEEIVHLITSEHGKTLEDARGELARGLEVVEFATGIPQLLKGEFSENVGTGVDSWSLRQPLGVCVGITPFNFPAMVPLWMFPVAIACGNTFILKPSDKTPGAALRLAELLHEAGVPKGVINVVNGDARTVEMLLEHPVVGAVSFVGSTPVAERVYRIATTAGKRVQALGGAKNHAIVLSDADVSHTAASIVGAAFGSAGQRCMAVSVAVAVGDVADALVAEIVRLARGLRIGAGNAPGVELGPVISGQQRQRIVDYIESGVAEGARIVLDGRAPTGADPQGFFLGATVLDAVTPAMRVYRDEIFGPVLCVVRIPNFDAALRLVHGHEFANGVALFTRDGGTARRFVADVEVGMVGINVPIPVPMAFHSFGGWKRSIFGDVGVHGQEGVRFYTRLKTVTSRWPTGSDAARELAMPVMR
jgi:malonate-semialdehyde dehydrogenase (acetylating)/methylmalonate-semialdehyde dehydrogenase